MYLKSYWCVLLGSLVIIQESSSLAQTSDSAFRKNAPEKPVFPETFQVQVHGLFRDDNSEVDGSLYYDIKNNRATIEILWKGERRRLIYNFDANELVTINGISCSVVDIDNDPKKSIIPFTVDESSKKKIIAPAEMPLYFYNSTFYRDDLIYEIPISLYVGVVDVPEHQLKECTVTHAFTKKNFETSLCEEYDCKPKLLQIVVHCSRNGEEINHLYQFYQFRESISDESVFHAPSGVFCQRNQTREIPILPTYFSFFYDIITRDTQITTIGAVDYLHEELWYDGDLKLLRVDDFNGDNHQQFTKVYDFLNEVSYVIPAKFAEDKVGSIGSLTMEMTLNMATFLPDDIFPYKFRKGVSNPVYVGKRKVHELNYDVWSVMAETPDSNFRVVTDIYYTEIPKDVTGILTEVNLILSYLEIYIYETDEDFKPLKLVETKFISITEYRTAPRAWSAFDVSRCFSTSQKKAIEINIEGPKVNIGSKVYNDVLEQLYLKTVTLTGVSVIRISDLKMISSDENSTIFKGWILENPFIMEFGKNNTEPDMNTAYNQLEKGIKEGLFSFNATDENKEVFQYSVSSLNPTDKKTEDKGKPGGYSGGAMAGIAIVMLIVGIVLGVVGLVAFLRSKKGAEAQKLVSST